LSEWKSFDVHLTIKAETPEQVRAAYGRVALFANSWLIESGHRMPETMPGGLLFWCTDDENAFRMGETPKPRVPDAYAWGETIDQLTEQEAKELLRLVLDYSREEMLRCKEVLNGKGMMYRTEGETRQLVPGLWGQHNAHNHVQHLAVDTIRRFREQSGR
jgi:hypothetical protein